MILEQRLYQPPQTFDVLHWKVPQSHEPSKIVGPFWEGIWIIFTTGLGDFHGGMVIHAGHGHWAFLEFCELHLLLLRALILWHDYLSGLFFVGLRFKKMLLMTSIKPQHCIGRLDRPLVSNNNSCIYLAKLGLPWPLGRQSDIPYNFDDT